MANINLKITTLRKRNGISQQELADILGVTFQSVSKWETGINMPDITLLPSIAEYFHVSVDELLGLKPIQSEEYIPANTDNRDHWNQKSNMLYKNRKYFWNDDYLEFLVKNVWNINKPVDIIEFRCGNGYLGKQLLALLPVGSTYTGIDSEYFVNEAKLYFQTHNQTANFIISDIYSFKATKQYDIAISEVGLRHVNRPLEILSAMKNSIKKDGLVICIDVNREFEHDGLYINDIDYNYLCTTFDYHKIWKMDLEKEGRDYAIGMRLPFYMKQLGFHDIDIRTNDKVFYVSPEMQDYTEKVQDFIDINGYGTKTNRDNDESIVEYFMSRGLSRNEAESYIKLRDKLSDYFSDKEKEKSFLKVQGLLITYGRK
jgi:transcriptional regulator with XRE-family HTH domain